MIITSLKDMDEIRAANILNLPKELSFYSWPKAWSQACTGFVCEGLKPGFFNSIKISLFLSLIVFIASPTVSKDQLSSIMISTSSSITLLS